MARSSTKKKATGFMIYSEDYLPVFRCLSKNDGYDLFMALLKYAGDSEEPFEEPEFENPVVKGLFEIFLRKIDDGRENYIKTCEARSRNARKRWEKEKASQSINDANAYESIQYDAKDANSNSNYNSNSNSNSNYNSNNNGNSNDTRRRYGAYNNVLLSDDEVDRLKEEFPYDCQSRIEELSEYMASSGKTYRNHLATIRSWARKETAEPSSSKGRYKKREVIPMVLDDDLPF